MKTPVFWVYQTTSEVYCNDCVPSKYPNSEEWGEICRHDLEGPHNPAVCSVSVCGWVHPDDRPTDDDEEEN